MFTIASFYFAMRREYPHMAPAACWRAAMRDHAVYTSEVRHG